MGRGFRKVVLNFAKSRYTNCPKKLIMEGIVDLVCTQKFPKNQHFLLPCAYQEVGNVSFFRKFCVRTK